MNSLRNTLLESIRLRQLLLDDPGFEKGMEECIVKIIGAFQSGGKLLLCGNGGSASDAQHIAAELSGRFAKDRAPLFAEALHVNGSYLTAAANDYGYDEVYARLVKAMGRKGDVLIGLSTSGRSANVLHAIIAAKSQGMHTFAFLGKDKGPIGEEAEVAIHVPSGDTPRIQEVHITLGHVLCAEIEKRIFP